MKTTNRRALISVTQLVAAILMFPTFFMWASWLNAVRPAETQLPPGWRAGVMNHGEYYKWVGTVYDNPIGFAICSFALFLEIGFLIYSTVYMQKK